MNRPPDILDDDALTVYVDGSMYGGPRRGGIGVLFVWVNVAGDEETWDSSIPSTTGATNNEMELEAPIEALKTINRGRVPVDLGRFNKVVIRTDSTYVHSNVPNAIWTWRKTGWVKRGGASVLRSRMWKELIKEMKKMQERHRLLVHFEKIEGKKGRHAKTVDKLAKQSAKSASFGRARPNIVTRKRSKEQVERGSVKVESQTFAVRIIQAQYIPPPRRGSRYKYEVVEGGHPAFGKLDWAESDLDLQRSHTYVVRMNDEQRNPRFDELVREVEEELSPLIDTLRELARQATAHDVAGGLGATEPAADASRVRGRLDKLVEEGKARKTQSSGPGRPYVYESIEQSESAGGDPLN
jgi:ribonuclease HI